MYENCWLSYRLISESKKEAVKVYCEEKNSVIDSALEEIRNAFEKLFKRTCTLNKENNVASCEISLIIDSSIKAQGYHLEMKNGRCQVKGGDSNGVLYGVYAMLRNIQMQEDIEEFEDCEFEETSIPDNSFRMLNHWDNMDGSIERGYSGNSFFFEKDEVIVNERTKDYARMVSSIGINAVVINNVNVRYSATELISTRYYQKLREMSEVFSAYGILLYLSINYAAPIELGGLSSADPCAEEVKEFWKQKAKEVWSNVPQLGGFLIKADSEGRPGPFTYGRTHSQGANMLAEAVSPYGGTIIWRCFVYNCTQDWRDTKTDRARAGYDNFMPLDGEFLDNVILQIKNGPMDFQVREPISPLFGGLKHTNMLLEVQIAQEYTGQQRHVCYLIPWFKEILEFDMHCEKKPSKIKNLIRGIAAVANTGNNDNWTGHDLAAANLYGFGRLSFSTDLSAEEIAREWIVQTFGNQKKVMETIEKILLMSWNTYEKYTSPLGIGWMVNPSHHYGPNVDGYEYDRWGTYHRADLKGMGVDRTLSGTGYTSQYNEPLSTMYANPQTCPEELLLFFHHMPYTHVLSSGKTIIQHIYDTHFEGANEAEDFLTWFMELETYIEEKVYHRTVERLTHQKEHSLEWRDMLNTYFYRKSGIPDVKGRKIYAADV